MRQNQSQRTSERSQNRILFLLSGEGTGIPAGEARALVHAYDPDATFEAPDERIVLARTTADPRPVAARVAFSRRVGSLVSDGRLSAEELALLRKGTYKVEVFGGEGDDDQAIISGIAEEVGGKVSLEDPDHEVTVVRGRHGTYLAISNPRAMSQDWIQRRPRGRAFFHPAAIFPKLSRALVNMSGVLRGERLLDPFCGTGSLLLEAYLVGAVPIGMDISRQMVRGARRNSLKYSQSWMGILRADSTTMPLRQVEAISTDIPYGRASSTAGSDAKAIMGSLIAEAERILPQGRKLVLMHPSSIPVDHTGQMRLEEEHQLYMHRKLTRVISILART